MINKLIKRIGFICLGFASLTLVGCFHIPDEDWLPSKNKANTGNIERENEMDEALNSFMEGIYMFPSERDQLDNDEINEENSEEGDIDSIESNDDVIDSDEVCEKEINEEQTYEEVIKPEDEITYNESGNQEIIEEDNISEE